MNTDRNLLFAVLALQADRLDREQFVQACTLWAARKTTPIADLLIDQGWLTSAGKDVVDQLIDLKLKKHGGDVQASLAEAAGAPVRGVLACIADIDVERSLAALAPHASAPVEVSNGPLADGAGRNLLFEEIGRGGMGRVLRGRDPDPDLGRKSLTATTWSDLLLATGEDGGRRTMLMDVFLLWHVHEMPSGEEDAKLIGVYASVEEAERAKQRVSPQPGFRDLPDGFQVSRYTVGQDHWTEGFVTVTHEQLRRQFVGGVAEESPGVAVESERWAVWRIDDNANTFLVRGGLGREEAERVAAEFTARGHKQTYWVEREVPEPNVPPDLPPFASGSP
jgi:hypothetical protein